jgi:hypothetical protein
MLLSSIIHVKVENRMRATHSFRVNAFLGHRHLPCGGKETSILSLDMSSSSSLSQIFYTSSRYDKDNFYM